MPETESPQPEKPVTIRLSLPESASKKERIALYKNWLKQEQRKVRELHRSQGSGRKTAKAHSDYIDHFLKHLYKRMLKKYEKEHGEVDFPTALLALGGYGREELCPYSDIDIMFLYPEKVRSKKLATWEKTFPMSFLMELWDLGFTVGYSIRSIKQAMLQANENIKTKNSMLEARIIIGDETVFEVFQKAYRTYCDKDVEEYIQQRLQDQRERRFKNGETPFIQEPEIKNGVGGLRDYQNLLWISAVKLHTQSLTKLVEQGYLQKQERTLLRKAYDFLLRVRHQLHFQSKRENDLLTFDHQFKVARALRYKHRDEQKRVEIFMRDYYKHAQNIFKISSLYEQRLAINDGKVSSISFREVINSRTTQKTKVVDGFIVRGQELTVLNRRVLKEDPLRILRVFRHCQQFDVAPDFELKNLITHSLDIIDVEMISSTEANHTFKSILSGLGNVFKPLSLMHELGVLERFLPEFKNLTCLVQHEYYHRYTADIHTLRTIRELDYVLTEVDDKKTEHYRNVFYNLPEPAVLYLILLLHDIGKGVGIKGHDKAGVEISRPILHRMQINKALHEQILFIIGNHLEMARFWQKHDIDDPETLQMYVNKMRSIDNLRLLYVHTYCDAKGTTSSLWNDSKNLLHRRLFSLTKRQLLSEESVIEDLKKQKTMVYEQLIQTSIEGVSREEIEAHCNLLPDRYFIHNNLDEITLHISLVNKLLQNITTADSIAALAPVVEWKNDVSRGHTAVTIVTWDRDGLFYRLAGSFSLAKLNIISAKAISRSDHITIDTFFVTDTTGGIVESKTAKEQFEANLIEALVENKDHSASIIENSKPQKKSIFGAKEKATPFFETVNVYHELELKKNIIEIRAKDNIGLLYFLAKAINENGYEITFARIATERNVAVDTFYIENSHDTTDTSDSSNLLALKESLTKVIDSDNLKAAAG